MPKYTVTQTVKFSFEIEASNVQEARDFDDIAITANNTDVQDWEIKDTGVEIVSSSVTVDDFVIVEIEIEDVELSELNEKIEEDAWEEAERVTKEKLEETLDLEEIDDFIIDNLSFKADTEYEIVKIRATGGTYVSGKFQVRVDIQKYNVFCKSPVSSTGPAEKVLLVQEKQT